MTTQPDAPPAESHGPSLRYMPGLDGLRALSVLAVMIYHYWIIGGFTTNGPFPGGFMGVEVFFVISGYLITSLLLSEYRRTEAINLGRFWLRRARRLLPALFLMLFLLTLYGLLLHDDIVDKLKSDILSALTYTSNWWQIIADRSYVADADRPSVLTHLWSLAIEEQFYLLWPPILLVGMSKLGRRKMMWATAGGAVASAILLALMRGTNPNESIGQISDAYFATFNRFSGILAGALLAFVWAPYMIRGKAAPGARYVLDLAGLAGLYVLWWSFRTMHFQDPETFRGGFVIVDIASVVVIAATVHRASDLGRVLGMRPLAWIGQRSYGLYLWHYPIFALTRPTLDHGWNPVILFVVRFGLTFGIAAVSYRFVEMPIRDGAIGRYVARVREAQGGARRRMATLGILGVVLMVGPALWAGTSLAGADPGEEKIHGQENFDEDAEGNRPDPAVAAALASSSTVTTVPVDTTPTSALDPNAVPPETAPPATPPPPAPGVFGVGDSVMLGARAELQATVPNMIVDAVVSRQFAEAIPVLQYYRDIGQLPPIIVVHLGTNGRWVGPEFDTMMDVIGPDRDAFFLTARMPRSWEAEVNQKLSEGVARHPDNAHLIDWRQFSGCHGDWFVARDGFHVTDVGAQQYANFVNAHVSGQADTLEYCP